MSGGFGQGLASGLMAGASVGDRVRANWDKAAAGQAYADATKVTETPGAVVYDDTADQAFVGGPTYGLGGQTYKQAPTADQVQSAGLGALAQHYAANGDTDSVMRLGQYQRQMASAGLQDKLTQAQIDMVPTQQENAKLELAQKKLQADWQAASRKGLPGMLDFYTHGVDDGKESNVVRDPKTGALSIYLRPKGSAEQGAHWKTYKGNADFGLTPETEAAVDLHGMMGDPKNQMELLKINATAMSKKEALAQRQAEQELRMAIYGAKQGAGAAGIGTPIGMSDDGTKMLYSNPKSPNGVSEIAIPEGYSKLFPKTTGVAKPARAFDPEYLKAAMTEYQAIQPDKNGVISPKALGAFDAKYEGVRAHLSGSAPSLKIAGAPVPSEPGAPLGAPTVAVAPAVATPTPGRSGGLGVLLQGTGGTVLPTTGSANPIAQMQANRLAQQAREDAIQAENARVTRDAFYRSLQNPQQSRSN